jgi:excisionase family DNA binding protein
MVDEACAVARVGRNNLYRAIQTGALRAKKLGNKTLILTDDLRAWLKNLPDFVSESSGTPEAVTAAAPSAKRRLVGAE